MLSIQAFRKAETLAAKIIADAGIHSPPVPIESILSENGINIIEYNLGNDISGVLFVREGKGVIGYNPKDSLARIRFTIAHEYGHFLLHKEGHELFVDKDFLFKKFRNANSYTDAEKRQEQEANAFAAALLMPKFLLDAEMEKSELSDFSESELVSILAKKFKVSDVAMSYRIANLNSYF